MITAFIIAVVIVAVVVGAAVAIAAALDKPHGRHRLDGEKTARYFRSLATDPGAASPAPEAAAHAPAPVENAAAALPAPPQAPVQGAGQHPFAPVIMQFPGGEVGILGADGRWHIKPLAWQPGIRETGGLPALVRPGRVAYEAWRDAAVNE